MPFRFAPILIFSLVVAPVQASTPRQINLGEWNIRVSQNITGLPAGTLQFRLRECLDSAHPIPTKYLQASSCDVLSQHFVYHTLHYKLSCFGRNGTFTNEGVIRFGRLHLAGRSKSDTGRVDGQSTVMRYTLSGTRAGSCD